MDPVILLEVRDRRLRLRARHRVGEFPAAIGRAPDNDIILDDRYVDPHHAMLVMDPDGVPALEDMHSVNGVVDGLRGGRVARLRLPSGATARIGETVLRIVDLTHPVAGAVPLAGENRFLRTVRQPAAAWTVVGLAVTLLGGFIWLAEYNDAGWSTAVGGAMAVLIGLAVWAGIWAMIGRAAEGQARYLTHLAIGSVAIMVLASFGMLMNVAEFAWPDTAARRWAQAIGAMLVGAAFLGLHLAAATRMTPRRRRIVALLLGLAAMGVSTSDQWRTDTFDAGLHYSDRLEPLGAGTVHTVTLEGLLDAAQAERAGLDSLASVPHGVTAPGPTEPRSDTARQSPAGCAGSGSPDSGGC